MVLLVSTSSVERALREENELLRERLRQLEEILNPSSSQETIRVFCSALGLSSAEGALLDLLMRRAHVSREQYQAACCNENTDGESTISVRICFLRKRLAKVGASITTVWGRGYYLPEADKIIIRKAVDAWFTNGRPRVRPAYQSNREREVVANV
jgi:DNA-binding response OmpR family regulator